MLADGKFGGLDYASTRLGLSALDVVARDERVEVDCFNASTDHSMRPGGTSGYCVSVNSVQSALHAGHVVGAAIDVLADTKQRVMYRHGVAAVSDDEVHRFDEAGCLQLLPGHLSQLFQLSRLRCGKVSFGLFDGYFHSALPLSYLVQFSTCRPFTRPKSLTLLVTMIAPMARACAAIMRSAAPSCAPRRFRSARISA